MFVPAPFILTQQELALSTGPYAAGGYYQANSETIDLPSGITSGCLGVLWDLASNTWVSPGDVTPSGWTEVSSSTFGTGNRARVSFKTLGPGDSSATITGMVGTNATRKRLLVVQPNITGGGWLVNGAADAALQTTNPSELSRSKSHTDKFFAVAVAMCVGGVPALSVTPSEDYGPNQSGETMMSYWFLDPAGATLTADMGNDGTINYLTLQAFNYIY